MIPAILIGYVVGSLPIGYLVAQRAGGIDLRQVGSGNVGATNVYRTTGLAIAIAVMLADIGKGALAVLLAGSAPGGRRVAAVVGHIYPDLAALSRRQGRGHRERRVRDPRAGPDVDRRRDLRARRRADAIRLARIDRRDHRAADR